MANLKEHKKAQRVNNGSHTSKRPSQHHEGLKGLLPSIPEKGEGTMTMTDRVSSEEVEMQEY